ncbi:MAG: penicillin-binding protein activator [Desulfuromonas sp.]|nr:penicillin-binding protein activator [Desulfuromonas sp.]
MLKPVCRVLILVALLMTLVPAVSVAVELMATAESSLSIEPARTLYQGGEPDAALSFLRRYLLEHPDSPHLNAAHQLMARILLEEQRQRDALFFLQRIDPQQRSSEAQLLQAAALQQLGQLDEADPLLESLSGDDFFGADLPLYYGCRACSLSARNESLQALVILSQAFRSTDLRYHDFLYAQVQQILQNQSAEMVAEAAFMFADTPIRDVVILYQAQQAIDMGDRDRARVLAQPLITQGEIIAVQVAAAKILDQVAGMPWHQRAIGVVLPLSGRYAPFGELVKRGIELAVSQQPQPRSRMIYVDSAADPRVAADAVRRLVQVHRVMAVIGPLIGDAAERGVVEADKARVPVLTLSHRQGLPQLGSYVFRNSLTAQQQVDALADYAINTLGINSYAVLSPDNRMGQDFAAKFSAAIEERGGDMEYRLSYADKSTDFRRQLVLLKGEDPDEPVDKQEPLPEEEAEEEPIPGWPTVEFEALFIPDYADTIALLAPQLAYYGIENVQLLGINGWNSPTLLKQAGRYARGGVFSDGFFAQSPDPQVKDFVRDYQQQLGEAPSILEAQGYDSARLLLQLLNDPAVTTPQQLYLQLMNLENYPGVTGLAGFDDQGEAERMMFLLQLGRRRILQLQGLPSPLPPVTQDELFE